MINKRVRGQERIMLLPKIWIICRVCLKQCEKMFNIFNGMFDKNIWLLLRDCGGVPVRQHDELPDKICEECLTKLWTAMKFRFDCQRSHRELVQMLANRNALGYEIDLEVEDANTSSELITMSNTTNACGPAQPAAKWQEEIFSSQKEQIHKNGLSAAVQGENESIKLDDTINQEYCVVARNENDQALAKTNKIVLLLKLKKSSKTNTLISKQDPTKKSNKTTKGTYNNSKPNYIKRIMLKQKVMKRKANLTCKICSKTCKTWELLRHHTYTHSKPFQCKLCFKRFSQSKEFLSHINCHTGIKPYYCRICHLKFADISNRNTHERNNHKSEEFKCENCCKVFRFAELLKKHAQSHRQKICFICNKKFSSLQMVRIHHQREHLSALN